jgi:alkylhydroperoxidase/carboxymuconolactone decarboxylase family protein YurZ
VHRKAALNAGVNEQVLAEASFVAAALRADGAVAHGSHLVD